MNTNNNKITKDEWNKMNNLLTSGYLIRIQEPCDWIWGVKSFYSSDGLIEVKEHRGKFLGGGVCSWYAYRVKLGIHVFMCKSFLYAMKHVYNYIKKYNPDVML